MNIKSDNYLQDMNNAALEIIKVFEFDVLEIIGKYINFQCQSVNDFLDYKIFHLIGSLGHIRHFPLPHYSALS